ncbi:MAG: hypothetical protein WCO03_01310 [bacterium]
MDQVFNDVAKPKKNINILKWILIVGIMIVLNLFFNYAISTIYKEPQFDQFCKPEQVNVVPANRNECVSKGGQWTENASLESNQNIPQTTGPKQVNTKVVSSCDLNFTCSKNYQDALNIYNRNVFVALVILGIISLLLGFWLSEFTAVSLGLSLGGVLSLIIGSTRYWAQMSDYIRVIILAIALGVLVWLGIKKIKD